jgi:hypothetical protein
MIRLERLPATAILQERGQQVRVAAPAREVKLAEGDVLLTRTREAPVQRAAPVRLPGAVAWTTPYEVRVRPAGGGGAVRTARLVAVATAGGLRLEPDGTSYAGGLLLGLEDRDDPAGPPFRLPSEIQIVVSAPVDRIDPVLVPLGATGVWKEVKLSALAPPDTFAVSLRSPLEREGQALQLRTVRPELRVDVSPAGVGAFGLESATVTVRVVGMAHPAGRRVTLAADAGRLAATEVELGPDGTGSTALRSGAIGTTTVRATVGWSPEVRSATVRYEVPGLFLAAALAGGLTGAAIRHLRARRRGGRTRAAARELALGALTGLVVAAAQAVGVNLLGIGVPAGAGEAVVFVVAALGAAWGIPAPKGGEGAGQGTAAHPGA